MLKTDIPFSRDDANRFLPWMIGLMCGIAALMLCVGLTLGGWVREQNRVTDSGFTVQIPSRGEKQLTAAKQVQAIIEKAAGVKGTTLLSDADVRNMVSPWLGASESLKALPMPSVIEAEANGPVDFPALKEQIARIAPDATLDTQAVWAEKFARLSGLIETGIYAVAAVILLALAGMMVFTARAAMKLHAGTVQLLHSIGADDAYIARQFHANALSLALRGAVPGSLIAGGLYALLTVYAWRLDVPIASGALFSMHHVLMLVVLPGLSCLISVLAVRKAALGQLGRMA